MQRVEKLISAKNGQLDGVTIVKSADYGYFFRSVPARLRRSAFAEFWVYDNSPSYRFQGCSRKCIGCGADSLMLLWHDTNIPPTAWSDVSEHKSAIPIIHEGFWQDRLYFSRMFQENLNANNHSVPCGPATLRPPERTSSGDHLETCRQRWTSVVWTSSFCRFLFIFTAQSIIRYTKLPSRESPGAADGRGAGVFPLGQTARTA